MTFKNKIHPENSDHSRSFDRGELIQELVAEKLRQTRD